MTAIRNEGLIDVRVVTCDAGAVNTMVYRLERSDGQHLPDCTPGSHIDLHLENGLVRQYSLVESGVAPQYYLIAVKLDPNSRGGSRFIHQTFGVGSRLRISHPRNNFALVESVSQSVLIAGGIGITPLYCMATFLEKTGKPWCLYYACRTKSDALFLDELAVFPNVVIHVDDECGGAILDISSVLDGVDQDAHVYCCGPSPMLDSFEKIGKQKFQKSQIHVEYFSACAEPARHGGFVVVLGRSGKEFLVPPNKSILDVLHDQGIEVPYSCGEGVCGACETKVLSGIPDHRDALLTDDERRANKSMMICCSGSKEDRLILDI